MKHFKLTITALLLTLGLTVGYAQQYGRNGGRQGPTSGRSIQNGHQDNYSAPRHVRSGRNGNVGYNAGATCGPRGRGNRTVTTTTHYNGYNSRGTVRTTRRVPRQLPATCFNGNRRTSYEWSNCGSFYYKVVERRRTVPGQWVYHRGCRTWSPGYTTWVFVRRVPVYG